MKIHKEIVALDIGDSYVLKILDQKQVSLFNNLIQKKNNFKEFVVKTIKNKPKKNQTQYQRNNSLESIIEDSIDNQVKENIFESKNQEKKDFTINSFETISQDDIVSLNIDTEFNSLLEEKSYDDNF